MARLFGLLVSLAVSVGAAQAQEIITTTLPLVDSNAVGLVSAQNAGLSPNFWADTDAATIATLINDQHFHQIPEARAFLQRLMVAELIPPKDIANGVTTVIARIDWLLDNGFVDAADALLQKVGASHPALFKRWFDAKLMLGLSQDACEPLKTNPALTTDISTKVFCLAQNHDWFSAELTLVTGRNLGALSPDRAILLSLFLDPDLMADIPAPKVQNASDPLEFAIREALALPRPATGITLSQSHADLDDAAGWQAQLRAGENLARVGAIPAQYLDALYSSGKASASGGVWDRVSAVQALHTALLGNDPIKTCSALKTAWQEMSNVRLEFVFAEVFAQDLATKTLDAACHETQLKALFLHPNYGALLFDFMDLISDADVVRALITKDFTSAVPKTAIERAVIDAFASNPVELVSPAVSILNAFADTKSGVESDPRSIQALISTLLNAGFSAEADRLALQYIVLERG